jgi:hypothetical protein
LIALNNTPKSLYFLKDKQLREKKNQDDGFNLYADY